MKKFTHKTILDYIAGNDIEEFTLEELEDDIDFMTKVINYTNDKKMIAMCSKRVQEDPNFVKFVLYKFSYDLDFICSIADTFLKKRKKMESDYEIAIIMTELTGNSKEEPYAKYAIIASTAFLWEMETVTQCKIACNDPSINSGEGFIFIEQDDSNSAIMIYYYARKLIDHIFIYHSINIEDILHDRFSSIKELEEIGINTFLIQFLGTYDKALANYIIAHIDLLDSLKEEIKKIGENWDFYASKRERRIYQLLFEEIQNYLNYHPNCSLSEDELLYSVGAELGICDKIKKYDRSVTEEELPQLIKIKQELSFHELVHFNAVKDLMTDIISGHYQKETADNTKKESPKRKLINIDFSTQKKG